MLQNYLENDELDMKDPALRHFILQIALKCADISNPCRPWDVSRKWSLKVCDEFFRQGDYERQLGLPVTDICDRYNNTVPKIQTGNYYYFSLSSLSVSKTIWHVSRRYTQTCLWSPVTRYAICVIRPN